MVINLMRAHSHHPLPWLASGLAALLASFALCCPNPAPATQIEEATQENRADTTAENASPVQGECGEEAQHPAENEEEAAPSAPQAPPENPQEEPAALPENPNAAPESESLPTDMSRAIETGVPMSNGVSTDPADVLLNVASALDVAGLSPTVLGVDESVGRVIYASQA